MIAWRVARSLVRLIDQCNAAWPNRSKVSDGTIGDAAHASRVSDHNPWYGPGIVTAADITHDPAHGANMHALAASLVASRDRRIKYIIWNRRIISGAAGPAPWVWQPYGGVNPHTRHLHLSVVASPLCDNTAAWRLPVEDDMFEATDRNRLIHVDNVLSQNNIAGKVDQLTHDVAEIQQTLAAISARLGVTGTPVDAPVDPPVETAPPSPAGDPAPEG